MKAQIIENETSKNYITHIILNGERIIPSDSFELGGSEYVLLKIIQSTDDITFLRILSVQGKDIGSMYTIPSSIFEEETLSEIREHLLDYKD